jgi:hypothetical protein
MLQHAIAALQVVSCWLRLRPAPSAPLPDGCGVCSVVHMLSFPAVASSEVQLHQPHLAVCVLQDACGPWLVVSMLFALVKTFYLCLPRSSVCALQDGCGPWQPPGGVS